MPVNASSPGRRHRPGPDAALRCLLQIIAADAPVAAPELASRQRLAAGQVPRLLAPLAALGLLSRTPDRRWLAGPGVHALAAMAERRSRLLACALPHLRDLAAASGRPVTLGVLWQLTLFPVYHGDAATPLETTITGGPPRRADRCASGRVLLAARPPRELLALLDAEGYAEDERPELLLDLAEIRGRQYAVQADRNALAVSVGTGPAAGLALHGPVTDDLLPALLGHLRATARQITESLLRHRP